MKIYLSLIVFLTGARIVTQEISVAWTKYTPAAGTQFRSFSSEAGCYRLKYQMFMEDLVVGSGVEVSNFRRPISTTFPESSISTSGLFFECGYLFRRIPDLEILTALNAGASRIRYIVESQKDKYKGSSSWAMTIEPSLAIRVPVYKRLILVPSIGHTWILDKMGFFSRDVSKYSLGKMDSRMSMWTYHIAFQWNIRRF